MLFLDAEARFGFPLPYGSATAPLKATVVAPLRCLHERSRWLPRPRTGAAPTARRWSRRPSATGIMKPCVDTALALVIEVGDRAQYGVHVQSTSPHTPSVTGALTPSE